MADFISNMSLLLWNLDHISWFAMLSQFPLLLSIFIPMHKFYNTILHCVEPNTWGQWNCKKLYVIIHLCSLKNLNIFDNTAVNLDWQYTNVYSQLFEDVVELFFRLFSHRYIQNLAQYGAVRYRLLRACHQMCWILGEMIPQIKRSDSWQQCTSLYIPSESDRSTLDISTLYVSMLGKIGKRGVCWSNGVDRMRYPIS